MNYQFTAGTKDPNTVMYGTIPLVSHGIRIKKYND